MRCFAGIPSEGHLGEAAEQFSKTRYLIIRKCVHGIDDYCTDSDISPPHDIVEYRDQKTLRFSATSPSRDDDVLSALSELDRFDLMGVEGHVQIESALDEAAE
jgi:hypothetical protein